MKKVKFLTLALIAFIFASCSDDNAGNHQQADGVETHSAISLSFPKTMLKNADAGAANAIEAKVTAVAVYIVDDISGVMHKGVFNSTQFTEQNGKYSLTSAVKTTTGNKRVYVVLNPGATLQSNIDNLKGGIFGETALNGTAADFVTAADLVMASEAAVSTTLALQTEEEALYNPLAITVQRNTAKIAVKEKAAITPVTGGNITNLEFALVVEAKKSYLVQQGGNTLSTVITPGRNISPIAADNDYFTKLGTPSTWKSINTNAVANKDLDGYYALENVNITNVTGNTTAAIIKGQFTPTVNTVVVAYAANGIRTMGSISAGESFYVKKSDNSFWSEGAYADALDNDFTAEHFSKKYDNGTSYYRIWVQDADGNRGVLRNNYYVLNITKISGPGLPYVPGVDPEDPTNPEDPDKPIEEDTYVSVEVTILPWNVESSDHEI